MVNKLTKCYSFSSSVRLFAHTRIFKAKQAKPKALTRRKDSRDPLLGAPLHRSQPSSSGTVVQPPRFQEICLRNSWGAFWNFKEFFLSFFLNIKKRGFSQLYLLIFTHRQKDQILDIKPEINYPLASTWFKPKSLLSRPPPPQTSASASPSVISGNKIITKSVCFITCLSVGLVGIYNPFLGRHTVNCWVTGSRAVYHP